MALTLYSILLGLYGMVLVGSLVYYLSRQSPTGDASVGWAIGVFYMAGLVGILAIALLLRNKPALGLLVLSVPPVFLLLPRIRRAWTGLYVRFPVFAGTPPLTLFLENNTSSRIHVKLECWFGAGESHNSRLYTTIDYYLNALEKSSFPMSARQTRLLAHKSRYVTITTCEVVVEEHTDHTVRREIQPCFQFYEEQPEAFRSGKYTLLVSR